MPDKRKLLLLTVVSVFTLGVTLISLEFVLRALLPHSYKLSQLTQTPYETKSIEKIQNLDELQAATHKLLPPGSLINGFIVNSKGFLSPEHQYKKDPSVYRIVLVGDSFAVGVVPYKQHFIRLLEEKLNQDLPKRVEVINLGLPAVGVAIYERLVALEALRYQPDLILVSVYVGNDFYEDTLADRQTIQGQTQNWKSLALLTNTFKVLRHTGVRLPATQVADAGGGQALGTYTGQGIDQYSADLATFDEQGYLNLLAYKRPLFEKNEALYAKELPKVEYFLNKIKTDVDNHSSTRLVFMIVPDEMQVDQELFRKVLFDLPSESTDIALPQKKLRAFFDSQQLYYIDLLPYFQASSVQNLYQPRDTHFNISGNALTAQILYQELYQLIKKDM